jgi:hypothetical protein
VGRDVDMGEAIAVTPTPPGVVVNRPGVIVGMTVEAVSVVNVAVDGRARVGVTEQVKLFYFSSSPRRQLYRLS